MFARGALNTYNHISSDGLLSVYYKVGSKVKYLTILIIWLLYKLCNDGLIHEYSNLKVI